MKKRDVPAPNVEVLSVSIMVLALPAEKRNKKMGGAFFCLC
jgi:hypothetical protein